MMKIRDRIQELRRVRADQLQPHPKNWRTHPQRQQDALRGVLAEIGYADALLARQLPDGSLQLIDGHLRAETTPEMEVPVLIVDLDDAETDKLLALHDPLSALAGGDDDLLGELLREIDTENDAVRSLLDELAQSPDLPLGEDNGPPPEVAIPETYQVVVECADEDQQQAVYKRLADEGLKCRLLML